MDSFLITYKEKAVLLDCFFFEGRGIYYELSKMEMVCKLGRRLRLFFGDEPQAGSKRGRPFDFSCSIQRKYGQNVNENLRMFERFLRKALEKGKRILGLF